MPLQGWPSRPGKPGGSKGDGRAQRPRENRFNQEPSGGVRGVFHRKRGGEPTASSTGRRACTGGQRQSYKRAGYLTRSGPASRGPVGTATAPRSSSWRGQTRFLEKRERGLWLLGQQARPLPLLYSPCILEGATEGPNFSACCSRLSLVTGGPQPPASPHRASWVSAAAQLQL